MEEALYLIDDHLYLHLKEVEKGFVYTVYDKDTTEKVDKSTILWGEMEDSPIEDPIACARSLALEEVGLEARIVESVSLELMKQIPLEEKKMLVLKVDPEQRPYEKTIEDGYESLQQEVDGLIQFIYPFDDPVAIVCNDEGKLMGMPLNRAMRSEDGEVYDIIAGPFLIVGIDGPDCCSLTPEQVEKYSSLYQEPEVFIRHNGKILSYPVPDSSISMREMKDMGYFQGWGFPSREQKAGQLFGQGVPVYMLNIRRPSAQIQAKTREDITDHAENGGVFAVSIYDWIRIADKEMAGKKSVREKIQEKKQEKSGSVDAAIKKLISMERD